MNADQKFTQLIRFSKAKPQRFGKVDEPQACFFGRGHLAWLYKGLSQQKAISQKGRLLPVSGRLNTHFFARLREMFFPQNRHTEWYPDKSRFTASTVGR